MASPGTSSSEGAASIAHLPDASEELAATADLTVSIYGTDLKLHSAVLAAGSCVLRSAFASCGGDASAQAAAVGTALEGHELADVQLFLRLLYNQTEAENISGTDVQIWQGVLELGDKLDAPAVILVSWIFRMPCSASPLPWSWVRGRRCAGARLVGSGKLVPQSGPKVCAIMVPHHAVQPARHHTNFPRHMAPMPGPTDLMIPSMQACNRHLAHLLAASPTGVNWPEWLLLADHLNMARLVGQCTRPVLKSLFSSSTGKQMLSTLSPLSKRTFQRIAEAAIHTGQTCSSGIAAYVPLTSTLNAPGDLIL